MSAWTSCVESASRSRAKKGLIFYSPTKVPLRGAGPHTTASPLYNTNSERQRFHHTVQRSYLCRISYGGEALGEFIATTRARMRPSWQDPSAQVSSGWLEQYILCIACFSRDMNVFVLGERIPASGSEDSETLTTLIPCLLEIRYFPPTGPSSAST